MIPDRILEQIDFVVLYVTNCDDWVEIKKQILLGIPSSLRSKFSTRDAKTKEQCLNDFEREIIQHWKEKTGITLKLRTLAERRDLFIF
jgi:hypothetical protein